MKTNIINKTNERKYVWNVVFNKEFVCSTVVKVNIQTDSLMNNRQEMIVISQLLSADEHFRVRVIVFIAIFN